MASDFCRLCLRSCPNTRSAFDDEQILKDVFPFWKDFEWLTPVLACPECKTAIGTFHSFSALVHSNIMWQTSQMELFVYRDEVHSAVKTETPDLLAENSGEPVISTYRENIYDEIDIEKQELPELSDGHNHEPNINNDEESNVPKIELPDLSFDENLDPPAEFSNSDTRLNNMMETNTENQGSPETMKEECKHQDTCESTSSDSTLDATTNSISNSMFLRECWIVLDKLPAAVVSSVSPPNREVEMLICGVCNKGFNSSNALSIHKLRSHPANNELIHRCKYCSKTFARQYMLRGHLFAHRVKKCTYCNESYGGAVTYKQHMLEKHGGGNFKCNICSRSFKRTRELSRHLLSHGIHFMENTPKLTCKICGEEFDNINAFRCHMNYLHVDNKVECAHCGMWLCSKKSLKRHIMRRHYSKWIGNSDS